MHNVHSSWSTFQVSPVYSTKILPLLKNVYVCYQHPVVSPTHTFVKLSSPKTFTHANSFFLPLSKTYYTLFTLILQILCPLPTSSLYRNSLIPSLALHLVNPKHEVGLVYSHLFWGTLILSENLWFHSHKIKHIFFFFFVFTATLSIFKLSTLAATTATLSLRSASWLAGWKYTDCNQITFVV